MSGGGNTGEGSCSGSAGGGSGPCGACKFLRRKCVPGCIFAPHFDPEQGATYFAAVHKVFGASNVSKLLLQIPVHKRPDAVITICYEAHARLRDPVYGCVAQIFALQQQVVNLQAELSFLQAHLATLEPPQPQPRPPAPPQGLVDPPPLTIADLPVVSTTPTTYDLSSFFDPTAMRTPPSSSSWTNMQRRLVDPRQQYGAASSSSGNELQALAHELFHRHVSPPPPPPATDGSPSRSISG